jgi:precorrin-6Y C5,15-methyltransferase (decarboxylating)
MTPQKIAILGIGPDGLEGLPTRERELLNAAETILGPASVLERLSSLGAKRVPLGLNLSETLEILAALDPAKKTVVVVGGDPLFYGLARFLCEKLGKDRFEVMPHVSSMQLAFARVKESWEDAYLGNLQGSSLARILDRIRTAETVGLFSSDEIGPRELARELLNRGLDYFRIYVCENLGTPGERITSGSLTDVLGLSFDPLNVIILRRKEGRPDLPSAATRYWPFGNPDDAFAQSRPKSGLITQAEVRALALAQMVLRPGTICWDIGAGSGAVAIEAARFCEPATVYAIEEDPADYHLIQANAQTMGVLNVKAVLGRAPESFTDLPDPEAIFIGGIAHEVVRLLDRAWAKLRPGGRLVANVATIESLTEVYRRLKELSSPNGSLEVRLVQISRGVDQLNALRLEPLSPSFLLKAEKAI